MSLKQSSKINKNDGQWITLGDSKAKTHLRHTDATAVNPECVRAMFDSYFVYVVIAAVVFFVAVCFGVSGQ